MRHQVALALLLFHSAIGIRQSAFSEVPQLINYQGRLVSGTNLVNGNVGLSLRLFNVPSGGSSIYEDSNSVTVVDGLYATFLGDQTNSGNFVSALTNATVFVEVAVNGVALAPRERIASVAYALATRGIAVDTDNAIVVIHPAYNSVDPTAGTTTIGGGALHQIMAGANASFIGGGIQNLIMNDAGYSFIGSGSDNAIVTSAPFSFIGGGSYNVIWEGALSSVLGGGFQNAIGSNAVNSFLGGGFYNSIEPGATYSVLGGGKGNTIRASAAHAFLGGGEANSVWGQHGTVAGGYSNAAAAFSFAAGRRARATNDGSFVWADQQAADFGSTVGNQFLIRASGGVGIGTPAPATALHVVSATNDAEISVQSGSTGGHRWTIQSSGFYGQPYDASFQIIDRTLNVARFSVLTNGNVGINNAIPKTTLHVAGEAVIAPGTNGARFAMVAVSLGASGELFRHPGDANLAMMWTGYPASLMVTNASSGIYYDVRMRMEEDTDIFGSSARLAVRDIVAGEPVSLTNAPNGTAGWSVTAVREGAPGPGFRFEGTGFGTNVQGLVTYWY
jgi:hypothetical protein